MLATPLPPGYADDLVAISFAAVIFAAGIVSLAVAALRRSGARSMLAYLGAFAALYGIRIAINSHAAFEIFEPDEWLDFAAAYLTYVMPIPAFLLFHTLIGAVQERLFRIAMAVLVTYSVIAIIVDTVAGQPELAMGPNAPIVICVSLLMLPRILSSKSIDPSELRPLRFGIVTFILFALHENLAGIGVLDSRLGLEPIGMICFLAGVGISIARRVERTQRRLGDIESELQVAQRIQGSLLPRSAPPVAGLDVAGMQVPAREVGGDFYDFVKLGDRSMGVLVADVAGHGVPAALIASMVKIALVSLRESAHAPAQLLAGMNSILRGQIGRGFVTATYAVIDLESRSIRAAKAGHPAPLLITSQGEARALESDGPVLGRFPDAAFELVEAPFPRGARVVFYTDGITEARGPDGSCYGEERLTSPPIPPASSATEHAMTIFDSLRRFRGSGHEGFDDDVTVVVVRDA